MDAVCFLVAGLKALAVAAPEKGRPSNRTSSNGQIGKGVRGARAGKLPVRVRRGLGGPGRTRCPNSIPTTAHRSRQVFSFEASSAGSGAVFGHTGATLSGAVPVVRGALPGR